MPAVISWWCRRNGVKLKWHQMKKWNCVSPTALSFQIRGIDFWLQDTPWHMVNLWVIQDNHFIWVDRTDYMVLLNFQNFYVEFHLFRWFRCSLFLSLNLCVACLKKIPWSVKTFLCMLEHRYFWLHGSREKRPAEWSTSRGLYGRHREGSCMEIRILVHRIFVVWKCYFITDLTATWNLRQSRNSNEIYFEESSNILFHYVLETVRDLFIKQHVATHNRLSKVLRTKQSSTSNFFRVVLEILQ